MHEQGGAESENLNLSAEPTQGSIPQTEMMTQAEIKSEIQPSHPGAPTQEYCKSTLINKNERQAQSPKSVSSTFNSKVSVNISHLFL